jgi:outer membrane receptor protein involved in Fe transport
VNAGVSVAPIATVEITADLKRVGAVQADRANTFLIDPYTLFDAAVTWRRAPLRVTLSAHNLFNQEYYWNADGETADPGRPRQVLVTISMTLK